MNIFKGVKKENKANAYLINEIISARRELMAAINNFNYADTAELVELYSSQITVAQQKYDILTKRAKADNLRFDGALATKVL